LLLSGRIVQNDRYFTFAGEPLRSGDFGSEAAQGAGFRPKVTNPQLPTHGSTITSRHIVPDLLPMGACRFWG
jgi:hypothetical protein